MSFLSFCHTTIKKIEERKKGKHRNSKYNNIVAGLSSRTLKHYFRNKSTAVHLTWNFGGSHFF